MKTLILFGLSVLMSHALWAGGDMVNNGGGLSEKTILFTYKNLHKYIGLCLKAEGCKLTEKQKVLLEKIQAALPEEQKNANQLQFLSESKNPGTFIIDGEIKVAKTGSTVGSPIYVNTDMLYQKNDAGVYAPTVLAEAVAILIHELGHHHGDWNHLDLDLLGVKVSLLLNQKIYTSPLLPWNQEVQMTVINYNIENTFPDVLLTLGNDLVDVSAQYQETVQCPKFTIPIPVLPIPDISAIWKTAKSSMLHNLHWVKFKKEKEADRAKLEIEGNITKKCQDKNVFYLNTNHQLSITFEIAKENGQWKLTPDTLKMKQMTNPWWKIIRLPGSGD